MGSMVLIGLGVVFSLLILPAFRQFSDALDSEGDVPRTEDYRALNRESVVQRQKRFEKRNTIFGDGATDMSNPEL